MKMVLELVTSFLTPLLWPLPHVLTAIRSKGPAPVFKAVPYVDMKGHFAAYGASLRHFYIAVIIVYGRYDNGETYPAFGRAATFSADWMWPIILRNIIGTWLICGFWDWWMYFGPAKDKLYKYKIVPKYPSFAQMRHDFFYTTLSSIIAGILEIIMCYWWASGMVPMAHSLWDKPFVHATIILGLSYWRNAHFYITHRVMHPWRFDYIPDVGKLLYRYVHSLHHRSYNITAFSGTNMHPLESTPYYVSAFCVLPFGVHPVIAVTVIVDCALAAWLGHDGHVWPGAGDYYHGLHHSHFDCNYGTPNFPLDYWTGSFAASKDDVAKLWGKKPSGSEANTLSFMATANLKTRWNKVSAHELTNYALANCYLHS